MIFIKKMLKFIGLNMLLLLLVNIIIYCYCLITPKLNISKEQSYYLYDNRGELLFNNYSWVKLDQISTNLIDATLATEDKNFYYHNGFDFPRIIKAIFNNLLSRSLSEGASTITQQYARNLYLNYDKTWKRKFDEAILALELETHYSKEEILEGYLNTINYGGIYGIENASLYYFNKPAKDLTISEASMLAGIPQSPSNNSPLLNIDNAKRRQNIVLKLMLDNHKITISQYEEAKNTELSYVGNSNTKITSGKLYFKDAVLQELDSLNNIPKSLLNTGGIRIYTTLDSEAQMDLEKSILIPNDSSLQTAAILMEPSNGEILALVGGVNYNNSQFNRAINAKRQVGSTMKPLLYYAALENGFTAASSFISEKTTFSLNNNTNYTPKNYNDRYANGPLSMGAAIAYSDNIYAIKTHLFLGEEKLVSMANRLGIQNNLSAVPSLALGTEEISLFDMVNSYAVFANMGNKINGHLIRKIEDSKGNILYEFKSNNNYILNESLVYILNEMLTYTYDSTFINYNYPTLISLMPKITHRYAIKSGTTNTDMWIIGYNKEAVLGVWTGYDDNRYFETDDTIYHKDIWINTMESFLKNKKCEWFSAPNNIIGVSVDPITGDIAETNSKKSKMFYFIKGTEPHGNNSYDLDGVFKENDSLVDNSIDSEQ